ncbi:MAG TPA: hypothetical protein VGI66_11975, partial [Streptosporangiaceae bacterium]
RTCCAATPAAWPSWSAPNWPRDPMSHWAHLVDLPHAEVVLVPWPDGRITRCYGPDQARELFTGAGLRVNWIRSRTVFSESLVTHWLRHDPRGLDKLVRAELAARSDESLGAQLVISASKPRWPS